MNHPCHNIKKKILSRIICPVLVILMSMMTSLTGYTQVNEGVQAETWRVTELRFTSSTNYENLGTEGVRMDVRFVHKKTGTTMVRPAFWDGENLFLVRFAPTRPGIWTWITECPQDASLNGIKGQLKCRKYKGTLPIYRHGFVQVMPGRKYMTYADGTPFFYLGDTHWGLYLEEYDQPGPHAGNTGATSHFKYLVDRRVEQGYTVYQSEPIGAKFNLADGRVDQKDIDGLRQADKYYQYIADKGLVHANAEFFFSSSMSAKLASDDAALAVLSRYWVARFGAYPVMWTLAQEIDNDFYHERGSNKVYDFTCNPWVKVAEFLHHEDAYSHPLSGHQENTIFTGVTGKGVEEEANADNGGASVFLPEEVAQRTGHNWWAAQWSPGLTKTNNPETIRDYWTSSRPAINYEGRYCGLWTKDFGSRAQGWISFLSGFAGYGYGAIDIWLYQSNYDVNTISNDGMENITPEDKRKPWSESVEYPSALQMRYLRNLLESMEWWNLAPVLRDDKAFQDQSGAFAYARTKDVHLLYFYARNTLTGSITDLKPSARYTLTWYNPRTGQHMKAQILKANESGVLSLPQKPDDLDWVMVLKEK